MKKILLPLAFILALSPGFLSAQCVIDTTITEIIVPPAGSRIDTLPDNTVIYILPYAYTGQPYSESLQFKVPEDTSFAGIPGTVDSITLVSVINLPTGMSLSCNPSNCLFLGGTFGCGELAGTPTVPDSVELQIEIKYTITVGTASAPILDTLGGFYLVTKGQIGINENELQKPRIFPNPANDRVFIETGSMNDSELELRIVNLVGSEVYRRSYTDHDPNIQVNTSSFTPGVYLYQLKNANRTYTGKFSISR